ncbi:MAG: hypothetical protein AB1411_13235 [Nitrospirota bacterium]
MTPFRVSRRGGRRRVRRSRDGPPDPDFGKLRLADRQGRGDDDHRQRARREGSVKEEHLLNLEKDTKIEAKVAANGTAVPVKAMQ